MVFVFSIFLTCLDVALSSKTFITYNAALYEGVGFGSVMNAPSRVMRRDAIIAELMKPKNQADVVCLQEVWFGEDIKVIMDELWAIYPYSYSPLHYTDGNLAGQVYMGGLDRTPACGRGFTQSIYFNQLIRCYERNCGDSMSIDEAAQCIASNCILQYAAMPQECISCILTTGPDVNDIVERCSRPVSTFPRRYRNMNIPDVMILSKTTIANPSYTDFHPRTKEYTGVYGYLQAMVFGIGDVACVHATPYGSAGTSFYPEIQLRLFEGIRSYEEQGADELTQLVDKFISTAPLVIVGDFNVGPAIPPNVTETQPANYEILSSVFDTVVIDKCTFCQAPEIIYNGDATPEAIDHIFTQGLTFTPGSSKRILDDVFIDGMYPLSDHFGVKQTFT